MQTDRNALVQELREIERSLSFLDGETPPTESDLRDVRRARELRRQLFGGSRLYAAD